MNDENARDKLAAALLFECGLTQSATQARAAADALLPVVREIAAEELRRAYIEDRTTVEKMTPIERLTCFVVKMEDLVIRADALTSRG